MKAGLVLVSGFGRRSSFINLPVAAVTLIAVLAGVAADYPLERRRLREIAARLDVIGIGGFTGRCWPVLIPGIKPR